MPRGKYNRTIKQCRAIKRRMQELAVQAQAACAYERFYRINRIEPEIAMQGVEYDKYPDRPPYNQTDMPGISSNFARGYVSSLAEAVMATY